MRGNSFGKMLSITTFGESHGQALGAIVDGVPPGLPFSLQELAAFLKRRAPGHSLGTSDRLEEDHPVVLSGIFDGKTLGTPICIMVENHHQKSSDYEKWRDEYRPGHADKTTELKYGIRDYRGGGRASGRETLARVIGGYFASLVLPEVKIVCYISKLGPFSYPHKILKEVSDVASPYYFPVVEKNVEIAQYLEKLKREGDSVGGQVSINIFNVPPGLGEPVFDKLKADFAKALLSIGAVVAFSFGRGEEMADCLGSEVSKDKAAFGGIEGGISNGENILMKVTFKPTSTIGEKALQGRHDPCVIPRAIVVLESMVKLVLADHYLRQRSYLQ